MYKKRCMGCMAEITTDKCEICGYVKGEAPIEPYQLFPGTIISESYIVGRTVYYDDIETTYIGYDIKNNHKVIIKEFFPVESASREPGEGAVVMPSAVVYSRSLMQFKKKNKLIAYAYKEQNLEIEFTELSCNNTFYVIYTPVSCKTLADYINENDYIETKDAISIIKSIMDDLEAVHKTGLCHLSLTPEAIMIAPGRNIKVIGFEMAGGLTKSRSEYWVRRNEKADTIMCSSSYYSGKISENADVFSIGALFYKMISKVGISTTGPDSLIRFKPVAECRMEIPANINAAISDALEPSSEYRIKSISDLRCKLEPGAKKSTDSFFVNLYNENKKLVISGIVILVIALICCILGFSKVINFKSILGGNVAADESTRVPYVINQMMEEGKKLLNEDGFAMQISDQAYDENAPKDIIKSQTPESGLLATICSETDDKGRPVVYVVVSGGPAPRSVPSVIGLTKEEAAAKLKELGFEVTYEEEYSDTEPEGKVLLQDISNVEYAYGSTIILTTSKGKMKVDSSKSHQVPSLVGMDYNAAVKKLTAIGMYAKKVEKADSKKEGTVLSQSVEKDKECKEGTTVTLTVSTNTIVIPDVTYKDEKTAKSMLTAVGVKVTVKYEKSKDVKAGNVIRQDKKGKSTYGVTVTITVSTGFDETIEKKSINIPDVKGKTRADAEAAIKKAGGKVGSVTEEYSDKANGTVIGQSNVGACKEGTVINLAVSKGKEPAQTGNSEGNEGAPPKTTDGGSSGGTLSDRVSDNINIPDVKGKSLEDAKAAIKKAGGKVGSVSEEYSDKKKGVVIDQSVKGEANEVTTVNLTVSKGEKPQETKPQEQPKAKKITIPDVRGKSLDSAKAAIKNAGGKVGSVSEEYSDKAKGTVTGQSIKGEANEGATVNLTVSNGEKPQETKKQEQTKAKKINIPDVRGKSLDSAKSAITSAGGKVGSVSEEYNSKAKGTVIGQSVKGEANEGATVNLTVSKGEKPVEQPKAEENPAENIEGEEKNDEINIPDVTGKSLDYAKKAIQDAGGKIETDKIQYVESENEDQIPGTVSFQSNLGKAKRGTPVQLKVYVKNDN